ncbi:MAG: phosphodiester glycosidase family protein [Oscillospiraceae bacterium]|nr:phosphodiester glycosidase family protein [Oscillospiraceae bacterium]
MKYKTLKFIGVIIIILSLVAPISAHALGDVVYTNTRLIADNLEYINTISWSSSLGRTESFGVRMTGPGDAYPIVMNGDTIYGTTKISNMVSYAESLGKKVLAIVNTDFFFLEHGGVPIGIVVEDGVYKSSPEGRNAVTIGYDGSVDIISPPTVIITLQNEGGNEETDNAGKTVSLRHLNKPRTDLGGINLFSETYSTVSTRTSTPGWFVRFRIIEGTMSVSGTMMLEVTETLTSDGAIPIGEGNLVMTSADKNELGEDFEKFAVGDIVTLTTTCNNEKLAYAQHASGGGDILVSDGKSTDPEGWTSSLIPRAPRTAFGLKEDGTVICYLVDGRNSEHSVGLTLNELADEMIRQGCVYAVNFDGGGSSAMSVRIPGESRTAVVNRISDGAERGCATYILFVTDTVPGGAARNLGLKNDGVIVLANSSVSLSFVATDSGYMPVRVPGDVQATSYDTGAYLAGTVYTAGSIAGPDVVTLYSPSSGASGKGEIYVITRPTSITALRKGTSASLTSVRIIPGGTLELDVTATYYRRSVISQTHSFTYDVSGNIGEMVSPGVFQAGLAAGQTGKITISAGGRSIDINVEIDGFEDMQNHWAREYAEYLAGAGITIGVTPTEYGPNNLMKRGDYILMLYRAAGFPETDLAVSSFDDVPPDMYYADALAWAKATGIAQSVTGNNFEPQSPISRQDAFTFTYRALDALGKRYEDGSFQDMERFPDAGLVADYAVIPTATLINLTVVEGSDGMLIPEETLTRAQMAKVLAVVLQLPSIETQYEEQEQVQEQAQA